MELYVRKQPEDRVDFRYFPFRKRSQKGRLSFADATNGVVCLVSSGSSRSVILFNPTIRYYVEIPDSALLHEVWDDTFSLGFGFEDGGGFKVVRFGNPVDATTKSRRGKIVYEVYSTEKGAWRSGLGSFFMNGIVHWIVLAYHPVENMESFELLMFDCKGEDFNSVKLPWPMYHFDASWGKAVLLKCRGNLSIILNDGLRRDLWVMEDYGSAGSWKKQELQQSNRLFLQEIYKFCGCWCKLVSIKKGILTATSKIWLEHLFVLAFWMQLGDSQMPHSGRNYKGVLQRKKQCARQTPD